MTLDLASFHQVDSGVFLAEFTTGDNFPINIFINTAGTKMEEDAVVFANEYLAREMQIRRQAAAQIFAEHDYIKEDLEYATADKLLKALEPGALTILWQCQETRMVYFSPLDDLESCGEKYVILVCYDGSSHELEINLEQASDW
jgi:hypothetical protein